MGIKLSSLNVPSADGSKWVEIPAADGEEGGFKIKVGSIYSPEFRSAQAAVQRHASKVVEKEHAGESEFDLTVSQQASFIEDEQMRRIVASCLILDWDGIEDDDGNAVPYDAKTCADVVMIARPETFTLAVQGGVEVAQQKAENIADTVEK
ncbi:hypothetical protein [Carnimonas bestiolae]|uniref:hypothetical protein n=1 Tax=Carnimonas bestiolae TaxID=3402172 RepID=UPI003EDC27A6